jgi:two-component system cell cycle response regulator DivK
MGKVILIVEDDEKNLKLARDILQASGYETIEARDGRQAVQAARERLPDLILMDMRMPVMDGREATRQIKADPATCRTPVIALTASVMRGTEQGVLDAGCDGYLAKPFNIRDLLETIASHTQPR